MPGWCLEHSYARLPELFYADVRPTPVAEPRLVIFNRVLAGELGLDAITLDAPAGAAIFAGNTLPEGAGRSRRPTPGTSSAISPDWATDARFFSASRSRRPAAGATSS